MAHWLTFDHGEMTVMEILVELNALVDESDPDIDLPNIYHAFQTAEAIRKHHPDKPWFHVRRMVKHWSHVCRICLLQTFD